MHRDLLAYSFDAAGLFLLFYFRKVPIYHIQLCKPLLFFVFSKTAEMHIYPPTLALYHGNSVYCLLSYVVDAILALLRPASSRPGTLDVSHATCGASSSILFSVEIYLRHYTHIRDWTLFTKFKA